MARSRLFFQDVRRCGRCKLRSLGFALFPAIPQLPSHYSPFLQSQWVAVVLAKVHELSFPSLALSPGLIVWPIPAIMFLVVQRVRSMQGIVWDLSRVRIKALACSRCFLRYVLATGSRYLGWIRISPRVTRWISCVFCYQGSADGSLGIELSGNGVREGAECAGWATAGEPPFPSTSVVGSGTFFFLISPPIPILAVKLRLTTAPGKCVYPFSASNDQLLYLQFTL